MPGRLRPLAYGLALVAVVAVWALLGRWLRDRIEGQPGAAATVLVATLTPAFGLSALGRLVAGAFAPALFLLLMATVVATGGFLLFRGRAQALARAMVALPPAVALTLALVSLANSARYGVPQGGPAGHSDATRPHIVLLVLDTVRADHLGLYGYDRDTMPALGRWARDARVFTRAVTPAGWTTPAHASILSGRTVSGHGIHYLEEPGDSLASRPFDGIVWLADLLAEEGLRLHRGGRPIRWPCRRTGPASGRFSITVGSVGRPATPSPASPSACRGSGG